MALLYCLSLLLLIVTMPAFWMSKQKSDRGFANANRRLNRLTGAMGAPAVIVMEPLK